MPRTASRTASMSRISPCTKFDLARKIVGKSVRMDLRRQVVEDAYFVSCSQQRVHQVRTDEASAAGNRILFAVIRLARLPLSRSASCGLDFRVRARRITTTAHARIPRRCSDLSADACSAARSPRCSGVKQSVIVVSNGCNAFICRSNHCFGVGTKRVSPTHARAQILHAQACFNHSTPLSSR